MKSVVYLLRELKFEVLKMVSLKSLLDSVLIFLGLYFVLILLNLYPLYIALPVFVIVLISLIYVRFKKFKLKVVEDKNPEVKEILRTVADNIDDDNIVVHQLHIELVKKMKSVASSTFIQMDEIVYKLVGIVFISFITLFLSANNIYILDMNKLLVNAVSPFKMFGQESFSDDIYGDENIAELGDEQVDFELNPLSYEVNIEKVSEAIGRENKYQDLFPQVVVNPEAAFEEKISRENQQIVKNYFNKIKE